jgi:lysophospholipase L1-like esterase
MRSPLALAVTLALLAAPAFAAEVGKTAMTSDPCANAAGPSAADKAFAEALVTPGAPFSLPKTTPEELARRRAQAEADWPNLCRYHAANVALHEPVKVVFMGDSLSELWGVADPDLFTHGVVDRGISGQTSAQMLVRFYADVIALHPKAVHLLAGANDIAGNTGPTSAEALKNNIRAMTELARAHHIRVILGAIPPIERFWWAPDLRPAGQIAAIDDWLRAYAKAEGFTFVDYATALAGPEYGLQAGVSNDHDHPNRKGYAIMTRLVRQTLSTVQ